MPWWLRECIASSQQRRLLGSTSDSINYALVRKRTFVADKVAPKAVGCPAVGEGSFLAAPETEPPCAQIPSQTKNAPHCCEALGLTSLCGASVHRLKYSLLIFVERRIEEAQPGCPSCDRYLTDILAVCCQTVMAVIENSHDEERV